jgi:hypothetical protein
VLIAPTARAWSSHSATRSVVTISAEALRKFILPVVRTLIRIGIPWLSRIPIPGFLFGSVEHKIEKTELLLLITPRAVGTALDAARITDQMRRVTPELEQSIRQAPERSTPPR